MAERRMFAKTIVDSDAFLDMPLSAQALYFHLAMRADDDGFINNPRKIQRVIGAGEDDCKLLAARGFILTFESGVMVIRHWKIHNYIRPDRYKPTIYKEEKARIGEKENKAYTQAIQPGIPNADRGDTQVRSGQERDRKAEDRQEEDRAGQDSDGAAPTPPKPFTAPGAQEVTAYCLQRQNGVDPQRFVDYYTANGWMVGRNKMKDWKAAVRAWERKERPPGQNRNPFLDMVGDDD